MLLNITQSSSKICYGSYNDRRDEAITQGSKREINWVLEGGSEVLSYRGLRCGAQKMRRVIGNSYFQHRNFKLFL